MTACAGGLPSVAVVDNQQVCVGKDASDAQLLQRPIICPPGGLRYAFATLVWKMHNAAAPCGSPTVQVWPESHAACLERRAMPCMMLHLGAA
jgi:hypothetical protein